MAFENDSPVAELKKRINAMKNITKNLDKPMQPADTTKGSGLGSLSKKMKNPAKQSAGSNKQAGLSDLKANIDDVEEGSGALESANTGQKDSSKPKKTAKDEIGDPTKTSATPPDVSVDPSIQVGLRYRIPNKLSKLSNDSLKKVASYITNQVYITKADRERFTENLYNYRSKWMDFERTGLQITDLGEHDVHVPIVFEKGKAMYARLVNAILGVDPVFSIIPNKSVSEKQKQEKEDLLHWVTKQYANQQRGIHEEIDKDCWNFVFDGTAITKHYWMKDVRKFVDVQDVEVRPLQLDAKGNIMTEEKEIEREEAVYDGPILKSIPLEDVYIIGSNCEDIDDADLVVHRHYMSKSDIIKLSKQGFFIEEAVESIISNMPANPGKDSADQEAFLKLQKDELSGVIRQRYTEGLPFYAIYESYLRFDIDNDGIDEEIVVWLEPDSRKVVRITYLDRISPSGKRPFVLKKLIHREGKPYGIGFAEMLWGIQNTEDYITNQRLDAGLFSIFPWFVFRAGSDLQVGPQNIAPGKGIPVDDVNDIAFPRVNGNPAYGFQEEQGIIQHAGKVTGVTDMAEAQNNSQGLARTATGAAGLINQLDANLDIYIKHYQWGFSRNLKFLDKQVQELLPLGLEYRVVGADGRAIYKRFSDRQTLKFECDFDITGNTINSNKGLERDTAQMLLQVLQNPIALQAGLVNPLNLYNVYKNLLRKFEIKDIDSYLTRPEQVESSPYSATDEINMILAGILPKIYMNDRHQEKLAVFAEFEQSPEFGIYSQEHLPLYLQTKQGHAKYAKAINAQAQNLNQLGGQPGGVSPMVASQIAAGSGNPSGQVPQQQQDMMPQNSMGRNPNNQQS